MQRNPLDDFYFDSDLEINFMAYLRMRYAGGELTRENFFKVVFFENEIGPTELDLVMLNNLHDCKPYSLLQGFNRGRNYEEVIEETVAAFEHFYSRWLTTHNLLVNYLVNVADRAEHLTSSQWVFNRGVLCTMVQEKYPSDWKDKMDLLYRKVTQYGIHLGALRDIAGTLVIVPKVRMHMLQNELPLRVRAQHIVYPTNKVSFPSVKTALW